MKISRYARFAAVLLATLNWVLPLSNAQALDPPLHQKSTAPPNKAVYVNDIALGKGGQLSGYVFDRQGQPANAYRLKVVQKGRPETPVVTNEKGQFRVDSMRGGTFQVTAGKQTYLCRGWVAGTAPPKARNQLLVVPDGLVERGQRPISALASDPIMIGLVVAAAVAIPVAISNSKDSSPPGS